MPTGKIGVYTRFFEYANFRLPLSTFLVNVLRHYRIHISQLSLNSAAKVSHFEILCRVHGFEPTVGLFRCFYVNSKNKGWMSFSKRQGNDVVCCTKPLDSLKSWNDHFFWVDDFACPASFSWNTSKSVSNDPFPKSFEFNAEHYATLVAYPAPFHKYPEPFLCLIGFSRNGLSRWIRGVAGPGPRVRSCTKSSNEMIPCTTKDLRLSGSLSLDLRKRPMEAFRLSCFFRTVASPEACYTYYTSSVSVTPSVITRSMLT
ncbi:hypothetical protein Tco_0874124 [Tanacetum coccineum]|uniref:Transposase (putative) gypsy type domain-containing protein n=1 Tax=Tanacetum coccineum TaxID=301880 RepID=A0ABQ5BNP2_9ASTR